MVEILRQNNLGIIVGLLIAVLILLAIVIMDGIRISKLNEKMEKVLSLSNLEDLDKIAKTISSGVYEKDDIKRMEERLAFLDRQIVNSIQNIGIIRFSAFSDMGSNQSFSIALLDQNLNGVVLTSIYNGKTSNTYSKEVVDGKSEYSLSAEEIQAIDMAKRKRLERTLGLQQVSVD